jgi:FkbM family methyltransferase
VFKTLRERIKKMPIVGGPIYRCYMALRYKDGKVFTIEGGPLRGTKMHRFVRTFFPSQKTGTYEPEVQDALLRELSPGDTFFDVGANGGFFSLLGAQVVGAEGRVIGFEPHPETARQCRAQLRLNGLDRATCVEAAICDKSGSISFSDGSNSFNRHLVNGEQAGPVIHVKATTLDEAVEVYGVPNVIKMDIEGAELLALQGATRLLREHRPTLILEIHSPELVKKILPMLRDFDYELIELTENEGDQVRKFVARSGRDPLAMEESHGDTPKRAEHSAYSERRL